MSGNKIGYIKGKSGFGDKSYKPGTMITQMNKGNKSLHQKPMARSLITKKEKGAV